LKDIKRFIEPSLKALSFNKKKQNTNPCYSSMQGENFVPFGQKDLLNQNKMQMP